MSRLKTILVGEDHADTASMLERLFESEHYAVRIAPDLDTLLGEIDAQDFDALILNGMARDPATIDRLIPRLERLPKGLPVVLCSAWSESEMKPAAERLGAAACLHQPVALQDLVQTVGRAIGSDATGCLPCS